MKLKARGSVDELLEVPFQRMDAPLEAVMEYADRSDYIIAGSAAMWAAVAKGSALERRGYSDIDMFPTRKNAPLVEFMDEHAYAVLWKSESAYAYKLSGGKFLGWEVVVNVVDSSVVYGTPGDIINSFDLSISQACIVGGKLYVTDKEALKDASEGRTSIRKASRKTVPRLMKFANHGVELKLDSLEQLEESSALLRDHIVEYDLDVSDLTLGFVLGLGYDAFTDELPDDEVPF